MRIAIDGRALTGRFTGDRTYWRGLLQALPSGDNEFEYVVYSRAPIPAGDLPDCACMRAQVIASANDRTWTLLALPSALRRDGADLVHVQYTTPPRILCPCPAVTTVHDISFKLFPEWFPRKDRILLNLTVPASMRAAARVITDSDSSRRDILRAYKLPPERVVAIPLGLPGGFLATEQAATFDGAAIGERLGIPGPFVLAVGVLQPRKNLAMLCEAFGRAKVKYRLAHSLVIAGKAGWGAEQETLRDAAARGGGEVAAGALVFPGYVADADLPSLYRAADLFAYPSLYEGFGLPPIEAMACGTPVIVSDAPALPEVVGDAAVIVPAASIDGWVEALGKMLSNMGERRRYAEAGPGRAASFSWSATAAKTRAVYRNVLAQG